MQGDKRKFCPDKSTEEIKRILRAVKDKYEEVVFTGGEPTLRPDITELVSFARNLGYTIQIQTNGRMFTYRDFCIKMISAGADVFAVSIHGHNAKLHDYLTSSEGSFEQSISGIKNLLSFGKLVVTNTVINKLNYRFLPDIANFLIKLGIPQYQFAFPHILGTAFNNRDWIIPRKKEVIPYVKKGLKIGIKQRRTPKTEAIPYCFLDGYEDCAAEKHMIDTKCFDGQLIIEDFDRWRKEEGKLKGPRCKECNYFQWCEGPWREYPFFYGWSEFIPVK